MLPEKVILYASFPVFMDIQDLYFKSNFICSMKLIRVSLIKFEYYFYNVKKQRTRPISMLSKSD